MSISIEQMFLGDYLKKVNELRLQKQEYALGSVLPHDEYAQAQGYISALRDVGHILEDLKKAYFPHRD